MSHRFWSQLAKGLEPYVPGEQPSSPDLLKLNTNESPYPPSPRVLEVLRELDGDRLRRYPEPSSRRLRETVAEYYGVGPEQVFLGNGSDEVLAHAFAALLRQQRPLQFPDISYSFYPVWCELYAVHSETVPLTEDFSIDPDAFSRDAGSLLIPNPNAPTGRLLELPAIRRLLEEAPDRLLLVDEAYIDFGGESAVPLVHDYDNLLVVQTLSKSRALAGLRVGLAIGQASLIEALRRVKDSFNSYPIDCAAEAAAIAAFEDRPYFDRCRWQVMASRESLSAALEALDFEVLPSAANFVFVRHRGLPGKVLFDALRERSIIVRRWDKPRIADYLRISVGTDAQCESLVLALREIIG